VKNFIVGWRTTRTSGEVTKEEVDLLFNAMDQQKDGILLHDDFESLLQLQKEQHSKHKVKHKSDVDGGVRQ
jgi:hypothetical protein